MLFIVSVLRVYLLFLPEKYFVLQQTRAKIASGKSVVMLNKGNFTEKDFYVSQRGRTNSEIKTKGQFGNTQFGAVNSNTNSKKLASELYHLKSSKLAH
jgi:hypothetical protein